MSNLEFELNNHKKDISFIATEKAENDMNLHPLVQSTSWNTYMKKILICILRKSMNMLLSTKFFIIAKIGNNLNTQQ